MAETNAPISEETLAEHRAKTFEALDFTPEQAKLLAHAKDLQGFKLSHHDVSKYIKQGEGKGIEGPRMRELLMSIFGPDVHEG